MGCILFCIVWCVGCTLFLFTSIAWKQQLVALLRVHVTDNLNVCFRNNNYWLFCGWHFMSFRVEFQNNLVIRLFEIGVLFGKGNFKLKKTLLFTSSHKKVCWNVLILGIWMQKGCFALTKVMLRGKISWEHRFLMVVIYFNAVGIPPERRNKWEDMRTRTCCAVELQRRKQIKIVDLLCRCSTTLHNQQGVFQCQYIVLQFSEIKAQQQQIDQDQHASTHCIQFFNFLVVLRKSQQLGNYLYESTSSFSQWQQVVFRKMWRKKLPGIEHIFFG